MNGSRLEIYLSLRLEWLAALSSATDLVRLATPTSEASDRWLVASREPKLAGDCINISSLVRLETRESHQPDREAIQRHEQGKAKTRGKQTGTSWISSDLIGFFSH